MEQSRTSAIVLAGGVSSRMGFNKALARLGDGGQGPTLIERTLALVASLSADAIIVANDAPLFAALGPRVVPDAYRDGGSLVGIYSGLLAAEHDYAMAVACDMPFLNVALWQHMLAVPRDYDVLMPRLGRKLEPLHAIYSMACIEPIKRVLESGRRKITDFLGDVKVRWIAEDEIERLDPEHESFFNVNTPADLQRAMERWRALRLR